MPRKVVRVYFPRELKPLLDNVVEKMGLSESEVLRMAFIDWAKATGQLNHHLE